MSTYIILKILIMCHFIIHPGYYLDTINLREAEALLTGTSGRS